MSFLAVRQELARRLYDPTMVFWPDAELKLYVVEALRTWNTFAKYWRQDFLWTPTQGMTWYDLFNTTTMPNAQLTANLADTDLYPTMEAHLLDPIAPISPWTGSTMFTYQDFTDAMARRLAELLSVTGCTLYWSLMPFLPSSQRNQLPDNVIDLVYLAYLPPGPAGTSIALNQTYTDKFVPDASPLNPGNWTVATSWAPLQATSGTCQAIGSNIHALAGVENYTGPLAPGNDQYASATLAIFNFDNPPLPLGPFASVDIRTDVTGNSGYSLGVGFSWTPATTGIPFVAVFSGIGTLFVNPIASVRVGDTFTLAIAGTTLYAYQNGVLLWSGSDATYASGFTGLEVVPIAGAIAWSNFATGNVVVTPVALNPSPQTTVLFKEDIWAEQSFNPAYPQAPAGLPTVYMQSTQPPLYFDLDVVPGYGGVFELLTVNVNNQFAIGDALGVANDWCYVLKWGALADMLTKESNAKDVLRATYCEKRYRMGLQMMQGVSALLAMRVNNVPVQIDSVFAAQLFNPGWRAAPQGTPNTVYYGGMNQIALNPPPDGNAYSMQATVVSNAPVPVGDQDLIQIGREDLDVIIDYAQHLAAFKMGGEEFSRTMPLLERFMNQAAIYGLKLKELAEFTQPLYELAMREKHMQPLMQPDDKGSGGPAE
jgi:hypothetical protein